MKGICQLGTDGMVKIDPNDFLWNPIYPMKQSSEQLNSH